MAKARRITGLSADDAYASAAAKIVEVRVGELIDHARGVLDVDDTERVRDMRVATRRLRAALEAFGACFPRREVKAVLREVKAVADALGARRDHDVVIAALEQIAESMAAPDRPGIETLIARLRSEQATANDALARIISADHLASLCDRLSELVTSAEQTPVAVTPPIEAVWLPGQASAADSDRRVHAVGEQV